MGGHRSIAAAVDADAAASVPILVFLGLSVLDLGPIRDRQTNRRQAASSLNALYVRDGA